MLAKTLQLTSLFLLGIFPGRAQEIILKGSFATDTVLVGEPVSYQLELKYPKELILILPDSTFEYPGLELIERGYTPTQSDSVWSRDKVVYRFRSWSPDTLYTFALPVYWLQNGDSVGLFAAPDTLIVGSLLPPHTNQPKPASQERLLPLDKSFNYPYAILFGLVLLVFFGIVLSIFGKQLLARGKVMKIWLRHRQFLNQLQQEIKAVEQGALTIQVPYQHWKSYLEKLENIPYTKLSSQEISRLDASTKEWKPWLEQLDRVSFGYQQVRPEALHLHRFKELAQLRYNHRKEYLLNA